MDPRRDSAPPPADGSHIYAPAERDAAARGAGRAAPGGAPAAADRHDRDFRTSTYATEAGSNFLAAERDAAQRGVGHDELWGHPVGEAVGHPALEPRAAESFAAPTATTEHPAPPGHNSVGRTSMRR
jgi:hypothetical protein